MSRVYQLSQCVRLPSDLQVESRAVSHRKALRGAGSASVLALAALALVPGEAVRAQTQLPPQVTPPARSQLTPPEPRREERSVTLTIDGDMERTPCVLDRAEYADITLTLSGVEFGGLD